MDRIRDFTNEGDTKAKDIASDYDYALHNAINETYQKSFNAERLTKQAEFGSDGYDKSYI